MEARGQAVITVSGTLVTLLFALAALVTGAAGFSLPSSARPRLLLALVAFAASAIAAVATYLPHLERTVDPRDALKELRSHWDNPADRAMKVVATTRINALQDLQTANHRKGLLLLVAMVLQVTAVILLALTLAAILAG